MFHNKQHSYPARRSAHATCSVAFPSRVMEHDRKLLEAPAGTTSGGVTIDAVVALDGNGMHAREHQRGDRGHDGEEGEAGGR